MVQAGNYFLVYYMSLLVICVFIGLRFINSPDYQVQEKGNTDFFVPLLLCVVYAYFLGIRPIHRIFGDTVNYSRGYESMLLDTGADIISLKSEWLWGWIMYGCKMLGFTTSGFFTVVSLLYFLTGFYAIKLFMPKHVLLGFLFMVTSLMFFTFAVNGIRNGLACHMILVGFAFLLNGNKVPGYIILLAAFFVHRSVLLPIASFFLGMYVIKDVKIVLWIWVGSIVMSFFAGGWFTNFFANMGFDDRMSSYATLQDEQYTDTTFRWDFLLYSAIPVLMTWYVFVKRQISENWFRVLCVTYCIANSFWVLVIRAAYSNRFAYLSWFLYPIIIAYPLVMLPIWENQDSKIGYILFIYVAFTLVMNMYWNNI